MCLNTVESRGNVGVGYKIVKDDFSPLHQNQYNYVFKLNKWIHDKRTRMLCSTSNEFRMYRTGFHILLNLEDARYYERQYPGKIVKVKYKNVVAFGTQILPYDFTGKELLCVVAKSVMRIEG